MTGSALELFWWRRQDEPNSFLGPALFTPSGFARAGSRAAPTFSGSYGPPAECQELDFRAGRAETEGLGSIRKKWPHFGRDRGPKWILVLHFEPRTRGK